MDNPSLSWSLIRTLQEHHLSLVNDESIPTFYRRNNRPQVLDLIWVNDNVFSWHGAQVIYDITGPDIDHKTLTLRVGSPDSAELEHDHLLRRYIPEGSEEEEQFIFFLYSKMPSWTASETLLRAQQFIDSCIEAWDRFSKPGLPYFNCWWNANCQAAKDVYSREGTQRARYAFLAQCKAAKKSYFVQKIEEMVKNRKPWEGTSWIKQRALPKVPQISIDGIVLNDLDHMFDQLHNQFAQSASTPSTSTFIDELPQRQE